MLDSSIFDLWSDEYEQEVNTTDNNNEYPFAGYNKIISMICDAIIDNSPVKVLDVGVGTGRLSLELYKAGNEITGIDFSREMLDKAKARMSNAKLYQCNFVEGLPPEVIDESYDYIISTYALHHLTDELKVKLIRILLSHLNEDGIIYIGDIGFSSRTDLKICKAACKPDEWDDDEYYFVFDEICEQLADYCKATYQQVSHCAGLMKIH